MTARNEVKGLPDFPHAGIGRVLGRSSCLQPRAEVPQAARNACMRRAAGGTLREGLAKRATPLTLQICRARSCMPIFTLPSAQDCVSWARVRFPKFTSPPRETDFACSADIGNRQDAIEALEFAARGQVIPQITVEPLENLESGKPIQSQHLPNFQQLTKRSILQFSTAWSEAPSRVASCSTARREPSMAPWKAGVTACRTFRL